MRDLETANARKSSAGGSVSDAQAAKLATAQAKLQATREDGERLQMERDLAANSDILSDALAEENEERLRELQDGHREAKVRQAERAGNLKKLKASEPERPAHLASFDGLSA